MSLMPGVVKRDLNRHVSRPLQLVLSSTLRKDPIHGVYGCICGTEVGGR